MIDWTLLLFLGFLLLVSVLWAAYPLRHSKGILLLVPVLLIATPLAYYQWGGWNVWQNELKERKKKEAVRLVLSKIKSPNELINKLRARLDQNPTSARGWFLLGRLYSTQENWAAAKEAFHRARKLEPDNMETRVNFLYTVWQLNNQQFNPKIRAMYRAILNSDNKQPDALAMLAMDAYKEKQFSEAISYWQRLLTEVPTDSKEARALRKAIAEAQKSF